MIYNQKEHEKYKERGKHDPSMYLALLRFEYEKRAFLNGFNGWVE